MTVQPQNDFPGWRMVYEYWREIESFSCRICAYHIVCYMCNDPINSFHCRLATTSRDVACFIHNKEHAFESGPSDRKQNGGAFFSSDGWWGDLNQVLWWCAILCIFRVVLMLEGQKCSINTYDRRKYRFFSCRILFNWIICGQLLIVSTLVNISSGRDIFCHECCCPRKVNISNVNFTWKITNWHLFLQNILIRVYHHEVHSDCHNRVRSEPNYFSFNTVDTKSCLTGLLATINMICLFGFVIM